MRSQETTEGECVLVRSLGVDCWRKHRVRHGWADVVVQLLVLLEGGHAVGSVSEISSATHAACTAQDLTGPLSQQVLIFVYVAHGQLWSEAWASVFWVPQLLRTDELFAAFKCCWLESLVRCWCDTESNLPACHRMWLTEPRLELVGKYVLEILIAHFLLVVQVE